jgi:hypothetical protein
MRRWIWITLAVIGFGMLACAGVVGGGIWYVSTQFKMREVAGSENIEREFARTRARFGDQKPLLDMQHGMRLATDRLEARASAYAGPPPKNMCLLVWSDGQPKAVNLCIPFWLLKMNKGEGLKFDVPNGESRRIAVSAEDIEKAGPALLIDERHLDDDHGRTRLLVWTE